jgi:hypothetical protein
MNDRFTTRLAPGQALTLAATRAPRRLVVTSGRLWLTVTGGCDDHWLAAGEGLTLAAGEQIVVEAWPQASFQLLQPAPERSRLPTWNRRMTPAAA